MEYNKFMVFLLLVMAAVPMLVFAHDRQELNGRCRIVGECNSIGYYCAKNQTCRCKPLYRPNEKWTKCVGEIGAKCFYDSHCIEGAYCTGKEGLETCKCRQMDGYHPNEDFTECVDSSTSIEKSTVLIAVLAIFWTILYLDT